MARRSPANIFAKNSNREIKMVRFVGMDWVVTQSYKANGSRFYNLIAAAHEELLAGQKLRRVPTGTIRKYAEPGLLVTFEEMRKKYGTQ